MTNVIAKRLLKLLSLPRCVFLPDLPHTLTRLKGEKCAFPIFKINFINQNACSIISVYAVII